MYYLYGYDLIRVVGVLGCYSSGLGLKIQKRMLTFEGGFPKGL